MTFSIELMHQRIIRVFVRNEECCRNRTVIGIFTIPQRFPVKVDVPNCDSIVKSQQHKLKVIQKIINLHSNESIRLIYILFTCGVLAGAIPPGIEVLEHTQFGALHNVALHGTAGARSSNLAGIAYAQHANPKSTIKTFMVAY